MGGMVVLDATPLTNFALANCSKLLFQLWAGMVCTVPEVIKEYLAGVRIGKLPADVWKDLPIIELTETEIAQAADLPVRLGKGERTCIAVASARQGLLVTDDRDARQVAVRFGVSVTGSIGVLVTSVRQEILSLADANAILHKMIASGFRSPVNTLDEWI